MGWIREGSSVWLESLGFSTVTVRKDSETQAHILAVPFISCGTLASSPHLSVPPFPHMLCGDNDTCDPWTTQGLVILIPSTVANSCIKLQ